jgi:hypothetical protein
VLSAAGRRADFEDVLIDAVTAWENVVGTSTETSFRVTAALTKLIHRDAATAHTVLRSLRNLYEFRSKVVHGAPAAPRSIAAGSEKVDISHAGQLAVEVAVLALSVLLRERPDLLPIDSTHRADHLLLLG